MEDVVTVIKFSRLDYGLEKEQVSNSEIGDITAICRMWGCNIYLSLVVLIFETRCTH